SDVAGVGVHVSDGVHVRGRGSADASWFGAAVGPCHPTPVRRPSPSAHRLAASAGRHNAALQSATIATIDQSRGSDRVRWPSSWPRRAYRRVPAALAAVTTATEIAREVRISASPTAPAPKPTTA